MSGFLTAMNASKYEHLRNNYIISKCRKILPIYWSATIGIYVVGMTIPSFFSSINLSWHNLLYSIFLIPGHEFILYPGWTLTYFFLFYIIYWIADKLWGNRDIAASIIIMVLVTLGYITGLFFSDNFFEKYTNPIMLEFMYGLILYYFVKKNKLNIIKENVKKLIGFLLIIILFFDYNKYLGPRWLLPSFLASVSILCIYGCRLDGKIAKCLSRIGDISLIVYILHPLIIRPVDKIVMQMTGGYTEPFYFMGIGIGVIITVFFCFGVQKILKLLRFL